MIIKEFSYSSFEHQVGEVFIVTPYPETNDDFTSVELTLIETTQGLASTIQAETISHPYSLLFSSASTTPLENRVNRLNHHELGTFDLFINPVIAPRDQANTGLLFYEIIFN